MQVSTHPADLRCGETRSTRLPSLSRPSLAVVSSMTKHSSLPAAPSLEASSELTDLTLRRKRTLSSSPPLLPWGHSRENSCSKGWEGQRERQKLHPSQFFKAQVKTSSSHLIFLIRINLNISISTFEKHQFGGWGLARWYRPLPGINWDLREEQEKQGAKHPCFGQSCLQRHVVLSIQFSVLPPIT